MKQQRLLLTFLIGITATAALAGPEEDEKKLQAGIQFLKILAECAEKNEEEHLANPATRGPYLASQLHQIVADIDGPKSDVARLRRVIQSGVDVNARSDSRELAVFQVVKKRNIAALRMLLDAGAEFPMDEFKRSDAAAILNDKEPLLVFVLGMYGFSPEAQKASVIFKLLPQNVLNAINGVKSSDILSQLALSPDDIEMVKTLLGFKSQAGLALSFAAGSGQTNLIPALLEHATLEDITETLRINRIILSRLNVAEAAAQRVINDLLTDRSQRLRSTARWRASRFWQAMTARGPSALTASSSAEPINPTVDQLHQLNREVQLLERRRQSLHNINMVQIAVLTVIFVTTASAMYQIWEQYTSGSQ